MGLLEARREADGGEDRLEVEPVDVHDACAGRMPMYSVTSGEGHQDRAARAG